MARETRPLLDINFPAPKKDSSNRWSRRRDIPIAILAWAAVVVLVLWAASHIVRSLLLLAIAGLLAFALAPMVRILQRFLPRIVAVLLVYIVVLGGISVLLYLIVSTAVEQTVTLSGQVKTFVTPGPNQEPAPLVTTLNRFGISQEQIKVAQNQIGVQAEEFAKNSVPLLTGVIESIIDIIIVAVMSIYLLLDGSRSANWLRRNSPRIAQANFLLDTLQRVVGGYIRGQFIMALLVGLLVGVGMYLFGLPYAVFLGALAFAMAFIPVLGTIISGVFCVLIGLTQGWLIALGVLIYYIVVHIIEGDLVGPRIVGQAVGLHPVVSLFALVAGAELFGIWGALFASPLAGIIQAILIAVWTDWRMTHPEQFHQVKEEVKEKIEDTIGEDPPIMLEGDSHPLEKT